MPHRAISHVSTKHPFLTSLVILLIIVIPGFLRTQQAMDASTAASVAALRATTENQSNAMVACQNANESRKANKILWLFVLEVSSQQKRNQNAQQELISEKFRAWIIDLYADHDCSQLDLKYPIPPPPSIPGLKTS